MSLPFDSRLDLSFDDHVPVAPQRDQELDLSLCERVNHELDLTIEEEQQETPFEFLKGPSTPSRLAKPTFNSIALVAQQLKDLNLRVCKVDARLDKSSASKAAAKKSLNYRRTDRRYPSAKPAPQPLKPVSNEFKATPIPSTSVHTAKSVARTRRGDDENTQDVQYFLQCPPINFGVFDTDSTTTTGASRQAPLEQAVLQAGLEHTLDSVSYLRRNCLAWTEQQKKPV